MPVPPGPLPAPFARNVAGAFAGGEAWLASLPALVAKAEARWQVVAGAPYELSFNYVAPAQAADGQAVVLKLGVPNPELAAEIAALRAYGGGGAVRLLAADAARGMLLLERLAPGEPLAALADDAKATWHAAAAMRGLWRPLPEGHGFPTLARWFEGLRRLRARFDGGVGPFPPRLVASAEALSAELLATSGPPVLLHGDLHHLNLLLAAGRGYVAIDPKGVAGDPAYEPAPLLENPAPDRYLDAAVQRRRITILAEALALDPWRITAWGVAHAVLSAWWSYEDAGEGWESACACAEVLASLLDELPS